MTARYLRAAMSTMGRQEPSYEHLSGGYRFRGLPDWEPGDPRYRHLRAVPVDGEPDPDEADGDEADVEHPHVIVARLHAEIAARSPAHASLVAAFLALPAPPPEDGLWRRLAYARPPQKTTPARRRERYLALRKDGAAPEEAAAEAGVPRRTWAAYEAALGGPALALPGRPSCLCGDRSHARGPCRRPGCGCTGYRPRTGGSPDGR